MKNPIFSSEMHETSSLIQTTIFEVHLDTNLTISSSLNVSVVNFIILQFLILRISKISCFCLMACLLYILIHLI